jgi:hypothetical protein
MSLLFLFIYWAGGFASDLSRNWVVLGVREHSMYYKTLCRLPFCCSTDMECIREHEVVNVSFPLPFRIYNLLSCTR